MEEKHDLKKSEPFSPRRFFTKTFICENCGHKCVRIVNGVCEKCKKEV